MPDLIKAMFRIMNKGSDLAGLINIDNPVEFTIIELAELVFGLLALKEN
jgi:hypothetical protein